MKCKRRVCFICFGLMVQLFLFTWLLRDIVFDAREEDTAPVLILPRGEDPTLNNGGKVLKNISTTTEKISLSTTEHKRTTIASNITSATTIKYETTAVTTETKQVEYWKGKEQIAETSDRSKRILNEFESKGMYHCIISIIYICVYAYHPSTHLSIYLSILMYNIHLINVSIHLYNYTCLYIHIYFYLYLLPSGFSPGKKNRGV